MLVRFSVENFLSFKDKVELSMVPDSLKEKVESLHVPYLYDTRMRLLKSISVYGHNSHGKSNFIKAYSFFRSIILSSSSHGQNLLTGIDNFRLNSQTANQPSTFEIVFLIRDVQYRYGFKVTRDAVMEEWLYYAEAKIRENYLFHRVGQDTKVSKNWAKEAGNILEKSIHYTQRHELLLSSLISSKIIPVKADAIGAWFRGNLIFLDISDRKFLEEAVVILSQENYRVLINRLIEDADLGFTSIISKIDSLVKNNLALDEALFNTWFKNELKDFTLYSTHKYYDKVHKLIDTVTFEFLKSESAGTIRFLVLASNIVYAIKQGQLIIIDEIDSKFHSLLLEVILKFYESAKINVNGSQMIFTTHNTAILDNILRRDQIVIVEKNEFGESTMRRAHTSSSPIRIGSSIEREYRKGKLGGISKKIQDSSQGKFDF